MNKWKPKATWGSLTARVPKEMKVTFTYGIHYRPSENRAHASCFHRNFNIENCFKGLEDWKGRRWSPRTHRDSNSKKQLLPLGWEFGWRGTKNEIWVVRTQKLGEETAELRPQTRRRGCWPTGADVSEGNVSRMVLRVWRKEVNELWPWLWLLGEMHGWGDAARNRKQMDSLLLPAIVLPVMRGGGNLAKKRYMVKGKCDLQSSFPASQSKK